jgi:L-Ala-D/L-Glu epimerase
MGVSVTAESFPLKQVFTISRGSKTVAEVLTVRAGLGRGECVPYKRYGETLDSVTAQIMAVGEVGLRALQDALPAGAARNAVDCALWDDLAKRSNLPVWQLAGLAEPKPVTTCFTLSLDAPEVMEAAARAAAEMPILKIKLGTPDDLPRLEAVRRGAPKARIIIDANEGWTPGIYVGLLPHLERLGVVLIEQPLPTGEDEALATLPHPIPVCADESCHDRASLAGLVGKYDLVNIKLDKTGGLTEALAVREAARSLGFGVMVGCMVGTSLAMAPALLVAQGADFVDLDGPLLLAKDRELGLRYDGAVVHPAERELWG